MAVSLTIVGVVGVTGSTAWIAVTNCDKSPAFHVSVWCVANVSTWTSGSTGTVRRRVFDLLFVITLS